MISMRPLDSTRQFTFHGGESRAGFGGDSTHENNQVMLRVSDALEAGGRGERSLGQTEKMGGETSQGDTEND